MSDLDDKYYYKIRSIQAEVAYIAASANNHEDGFTGLIKNEAKRKHAKQLLANIQAQIKSIQDKTSPEFTPEF